MTKKKNNEAETKDLEKLQKLLEHKFDSIEKYLTALDRNQKVVDQKNFAAFRELRLEISLKAAEIKQEFEQTVRAELQVSNTERETKLENTIIKRFDELEDSLKSTEKRLDTRIMHVGDLITVELGKKVKNLEKRVVHLETIRHTV